MRESNSRPLAPKARIIPLDQSPIHELGDWSSGMILASGARGREFDSRITPFTKKNAQKVDSKHWDVSPPWI